ncbi:MAG: hypothetical protein JRG96_16290 [Deltaproteobacteria bacterium]|nr:hypothetical protein [Deltaproteobacteria bacterium]MBW2419343.1 hypothetical protein [Deltaproteobacteria bacterium]
MGRGRFDHLHVELSVAVGYLVPRYALWLRLKELGWSPEQLKRSQVIAFCDEHLQEFLAVHGGSLARRALARFQRRIRRFDPAHATPEETLARLGGTRG